jgi:hypothetical protein
LLNDFQENKLSWKSPSKSSAWGGNLVATLLVFLPRQCYPVENTCFQIKQKGFYLEISSYIFCGGRVPAHPVARMLVILPTGQVRDVCHFNPGPVPNLCPGLSPGEFLAFSHQLSARECARLRYPRPVPEQVRYRVNSSG